eukprot:CAMPEP_0197848208 /NCGR_PEP_ID=MMETSP1438-20131217/7982_1 /TAXON_ID=1461541 /ORGANISM="Pterosperma sp., Strain CCMP1384" /LENGTH=486 /DNA_ID=CAMNT_0043460351 /DNA_START=170 /DNA_END=1630 /DNA_ORIENTATION=-
MTHPAGVALQNNCEDTVEKVQQDLNTWNIFGLFYTFREIQESTSAVSYLCASKDGTVTGTEDYEELGCVPSIHRALGDYANKLKTANDPFCTVDGVAGSAAMATVGMVEATTALFCLHGKDGQPCVRAVIQAFEEAGLAEGIKRLVESGGDPEEWERTIQSYDQNKMCQAFERAGCCIKSFIDFIKVTGDMSCGEGSSISSFMEVLPHSCSIPSQLGGPGIVLPHGCKNFKKHDYLEYKPQRCPDKTGSTKINWINDIQEEDFCANHYPAGTCPENVCQLGCSLVEEAAGNDDDDFWKDTWEEHEGGVKDIDWEKKQALKEKLREEVRQEMLQEFDIDEWAAEADDADRDDEAYYEKPWEDGWNDEQKGSDMDEGRDHQGRDEERSWSPPPADSKKDDRESRREWEQDDTDNDMVSHGDRQSKHDEELQVEPKSSNMQANLMISVVVGVAVSVSIAATVFVVWQSRQKRAQQEAQDGLRFQPIVDA